MRLQKRIDGYLNTLTPTPWPSKCIAISDVHASDGSEHDVLVASNSEKVLLAKLDTYLSKGYALLKGGDWWDVWRGATVGNIQNAHPELTYLVEAFRKADLLYEILGNHERPDFAFPEAYVFNGFDKTLFFDHGFFEDFPNDHCWWIGRGVITIENWLHKDPQDAPLTSPRPENAFRHDLVVRLRQEVADANPNIDFLWGHTHYFYNIKNNHNSGSPTNGVQSNGSIEGFLIEEGVFTPLP